MKIHQFATSLTYGDAISDEMLEIQSILREKGHESEIFVRFFEPRLARFMRDFKEYRRMSSPDNVVIFHFSIGSPVSKMIFRIPDRKIMIYHNITPYDFFLDTHRILSKECYKGRLEIKLFKDKVDLALGDSEFNRKELEDVGYPNTGVLPLLLNFSKFDKEDDPLVHQIFANGKKTVLFVGRVIPNKKFEDVIKTFALYQKYFRPESQLILAGDYRGMECYHGALLDLLDRLGIKDVHFTGHIRFPSLAAFFKISDVYLSMSEHEGFGVPLLEAFYNRLPVVAYAAGAVEETMNGGGVLFFEKKFEMAAAALDRLDHDTRLRNGIIFSQLKALEKYRRETQSQILIDHIERVIQR
jgi:glycosyltransferase involved in cell wall biosynthesis